MPPRLQPAVETEIQVRSRQEEIIAENIMSRANTWEVSGSERKFLTRERQNQEKVRFFQSAHQQLKYSVSQMYAEDLANRTDYYFSPEWTMRAAAQKPVNLAAADPSPELVASIAERAAQLRQARPQLLSDARGLQHPDKPSPISASSIPPELMHIFAARVPIEGASELASPSRIAAHPSSDPSGSSAKCAPIFDELAPPPTSLFTGGSAAAAHMQATRAAINAASTNAAAAAAARPSAAALARAAAFGADFDAKFAARGEGEEEGAAEKGAVAGPRPLPSVVASPDSHSSVLSMLLRTRADAEAHADAVREDGLRVPGPPELRRTITRIFANPRRAEAISEQEAQRRQRQYEDEKKRQQAVLDDQLQHEKALLQHELAQLDA